MPPNRSVLCLHCGQYVSRKQELRHRNLSIAPYVLSPPRQSSRQRRIFYAPPCDVQAGNTQPHSDLNPERSADSALPEILQNAFDDRWDGILRADRDMDHPDADADARSNDEAFSDASDSDAYVDWDAIGSESGLSPWDRLGESYDRHVAAITNRLSQYDLAICRAFAYKVKSYTSDANFEKIPYAFPSDPPLPKLDSLRSRVTFLAGFKPESYHCCPKSCCCYTGPHADLSNCPYCGEARLRSDGKPRKVFTYLPLIPRLIALAGNESVATDMQYRHRREQKQGVSADIFDGENYRSLRGQRVTVGNKTYNHEYFQDSRDVALGLSTDGFAPFKRRVSTAWPIILFNYNLPPDIRFHLANILALGIIPGPKKPVDYDSFLWPFLQELFRLAVGVRAFDVMTSQVFLLRAYLIAAFGDMPAMALLMRMKGHNGISACRMCEIIGLRRPDSGTTAHYVPLDRSKHPEVRCNTSLVQIYDPDNLPRRSRDTFLAQAREVQSARTNTDYTDLSKKYGVNGIPLLIYVPSLSFPTGYPYDAMHLFWENLVENLVLLWTGNFKGLDVGRESYQLSESIWKAIGKATAQSGSTIPSAYGVRIPDIARGSAYWTAEMWSFWSLYLGPILLRGRFQNPKYHAHFVDLVRLLNICLQFEITDREIEEIRSGFIRWVSQYEVIYYQHNPSRISTCPLTIHALLHVADGIKAMGPVWCYWAFPMERYCGILKPAIRSRRFPYASLDRFITENAQLTQINVVYNLSQELSLQPSRGAVAGTYADPLYPSCILLPPRVGGLMTASLLNGIAAALATRFDLPITTTRKSLKAATIEQWGKVRRVDSEAGDTMCASSIMKPRDDTRDASYVRYNMLIDIFARQKNRRPQYSLETFFGQLQHLFSIRFDDGHDLGVDGPTTIILAAIRNCVLEQQTYFKGLDMHPYSRTGALHFVDVKNIQCLVGRVLDRGQWTIIDRSGSLARAVFNDE